MYEDPNKLLNAFRKKHGDDEIALNDRNVRLFSDGATIHGDNQWFTLNEPPTDLRALGDLRISYRTECLRRATDKYRPLAEALRIQTASAKSAIGTSRFAMPPGEGALEELARLHAEVVKQQNLLDTLKKEIKKSIDESPEEIARQKGLAASRRDIARIEAELAKLKI